MSRKKSDELRQHAAANTRQPVPSRLKADAQKSGYRVVPVSLYTHEADWLDHICRVLNRAGYPKPNRSLIVREALRRLEEEWGGKAPDEMVRDFMKRHANREQKGPEI